jgi:tetratricopeptide (TPR) repeat protein
VNSALRVFCRVAVLVVAALALDRYVWLPYQANRVLFVVNAQLEQAIRYEASDPARTAILARDNLARLQTIERASRTNVEWEMLYAEDARLLGRFDEAFAHYDAALRIDHRPEIYFHRGLARLETGNVQAAYDDLVLAAKFRPVLIDDLSGDLHERVAKAAGIE